MKFRVLLAAVALFVAPRGLRAAERPLVFDQGQSTVDVVVKATVDSFTGKLTDFQLAGTIDEEGHIASARLDFHFRDVLTGKAKRDAAMHEWQHTREFPDASFALTSVVEDGGRARAFGRLTLHGVTRELTFPVNIAHDGRVFAIDGDAPVDTREFGLPIIRMLGLLKVDPVVHVRFHFQGHAS